MKQLRLLISCLLIFLGLVAPAQESIISSGPMPGFSDLKRVIVWVQLTREAEVSYEYRELEVGTVWKASVNAKAIASEAFTCKIFIDSLEPGKWYEYRLLIDGRIQPISHPLRFKTQAHWQYRTDPPAFTMAAGSCAYINQGEDDRPGPGYGSEYQIFEAMHRTNPELMLWLGDNVYFREPDWFTTQGMMHRYTHSRAIKEIQPFLGSTHHMAIWDDHDYGPNDSDRGWFLKDSALKVFNLFWPNPSAGIPQAKGAISYFKWNDIDFFLLDNRYNRSPNYRKGDDKTILGEEQKQWLFDALAYSNAPFKIIAMGGQFLNTANSNETYSNYGFNKERQEIIDFIYAQNIKGVIFLSGDRHHAELSCLKAEGKPSIYDFTLSALTAGVHTQARNEVNALRVEGSLVVAHNYGTLEFSGPRKDRKIVLRIHDVNGKVLFEQSISQNEF
jgi:alkaline phosphatase D